MPRPNFRIAPNAKVVASNESCPVAIMTVGSRFLGVQGHPEFTKEYDKILLESRVDRIGVHASQVGLQSLQKSTDVSALQSWVMKFIEV